MKGHAASAVYFGESDVGPTAVLAITYAVVISENVNRSIIAVVGAGHRPNLTIAGIGERNGVPFRFITYSLHAFPMMIVSIAIAHVYVWWRYF